MAISECVAMRVRRSVGPGSGPAVPLTFVAGSLRPGPGVAATRGTVNTRVQVRSPINWRTILPLCVVAVGVLAYANSFGTPFIFDDDHVITLNDAIRSFWPLNTSARGVADLTFRLDYAIAGHNPAHYHAVNLVIHVVAGLLLYGCILKTLGLAQFRDRYGGAAPWLAALCAGLWVAHPIQTESVTYICQRYESLMGMFFFLCLYCFIRGVGSARPRLWFDASIVACALGMGVKAVMAMAPVVLLLYDHVFVAKSIAGMFRKRKWVHICLFLTWAFYGLFELSYTIHNLEVGRNAPRVDPALSPLSYLFTQFAVVLHYVRLSLWPHPLCLDYAWPLVGRLTDSLVPALVIAICAALTAYGLWRRHPLGFAGAWFFVILVPTSSFTPISDIAFEHRMYLSLAGIVVLTVFPVDWLLRRTVARCPGSAGVLRAAAATAAVLVVAALVLLSLLRNRDYRSTETMWRDVVRKCPENYRAQLGLGIALVRERRPAEAERVLGTLLTVLTNKMRKGYGGDLVAANNPSHVYYSALIQLGEARLLQGRRKEARDAFRRAADWYPEMADAYCSLATVAVLDGADEEAEELCRQAILVHPDSKAGHALLAGVLARVGRDPEAAVHYRIGLTLAPDHVNLTADYAWLLATSPRAEMRNGHEALRHARRALALTERRSYRAFDVLAAALAETGNFDAAASAAESALSIVARKEEHLRGDGSTPPRTPSAELGNLLRDAAEIRSRLDLYRRGEPYRRAQGRNREGE